MKVLPLKPAAFACTALLFGFATPVQAQMVCGARTDIVKQLESKYGETRQSMGLQQGRGVVEVYASGKTGSWTILVTDPSGKTCLMAAGEAFEQDSAELIDTPT